MLSKKGSARTIQDITNRFWARVKKASVGSKDCWIWMGKQAKSYGQFCCCGSNQRSLAAHRVVWELTYGPIPEGIHVLHKCDNKLCVRPDHLFLGNQADSVADKFWARVRRVPVGSKECWIWTGKPNRDGYGKLLCRGLSKPDLLAHRVAWELIYGPIPRDKHILHHCDNPICVRPDHLFLGDQIANNADRHAKGRTASSARNGDSWRATNYLIKNHGCGLSGEKHPRAKLSDADVALLRQRWAAGEYPSRIEAGKAFGINPNYTTELIEGRKRKAKEA